MSRVDGDGRVIIAAVYDDNWSCLAEGEREPIIRLVKDNETGEYYLVVPDDAFGVTEGVWYGFGEYQTRVDYQEILNGGVDYVLPMILCLVDESDTQEVEFAKKIVRNLVNEVRVKNLFSA